jgi:hypothetical protein
MWPFCDRQPHRPTEHTGVMSYCERLRGLLPYDAPAAGCVLVRRRFLRGL